MSMECIGLTRGPERRECTLLAEVELTEADRSDWQALAPLHYRSHAIGGLDRMWALRAGGDLVGAIAYSYPPVNLAARNRALAPLVARLPTRGKARFWNSCLRTISRVVLEPNWRGLGLAARLVRETLPLAGVPYVEAMAAMARVHPFFERAGMTRYETAPCAASERLIEALATAGISRRHARSAAALGAAIECIEDAGLRRWLAAEIGRWVRGYLGSKTAKVYRPTLDQSCGYVARFLFSQPAYFLWANPDLLCRP